MRQLCVPLCIEFRRWRSEKNYHNNVSERRQIFHDRISSAMSGSSGFSLFFVLFCIRASSSRFGGVASRF